MSVVGGNPEELCQRREQAMTVLGNQALQDFLDALHAKSDEQAARGSTGVISARVKRAPRTRQRFRSTY